MEQVTVGSILTNMRQRGVFQSIKRYPYLPYKLTFALQVVEGIGKERNPKFSLDKENNFVYENLIRWVHGDPEMQCIDPHTNKVKPGNLNAGVYIAGKTGTGKSWALEIMSAYCTIDPIVVNINNENRMLQWKNIRTDSICDTYTRIGTIEEYKDRPVLGLQDFGSEPTESMYMGNRIDPIRQLIEYRGDREDKITLITSNIPPNHQAINNRYGDRVASRLNEMCNFLLLNGKDRRLCS